MTYSPSLPPAVRPATMRVRRIVFSALTLGTYGVLGAAMAELLFLNGVSVAKIAMFVGFLFSLPWTVLGFWNSLIGLAIAFSRRDPAAAVNPYLRRVKGDEPITGPVALTICIRNESFEPVEARVRIMRKSLDATGFGKQFDIFLLSDSSKPDVIAAEEEAVARLRKAWIGVIYRRRQANTAYKAGNMRDFVTRWGDDYEFFIPLDADSLMTGPAILRLVRVMQASPNIGILQSLVVGLPSTNFFTRLFQFGMRHGMRCYTVGGAWWQGDCGPYWGHNAVIRSKPFRDCCELPLLSGEVAGSEHVLSHDQVEAVLMRRAGYEVRVVADEFGSFEENPPALPEFVKRDLRWCQGNMQYFRLLNMPGLWFMGRIQLVLAILMYMSAPGWILFIILGVSRLFSFAGTEQLLGGLGIRFLMFLYFMSLAPKLAGLADVIVTRRLAGYGGVRMIGGAIIEFLFSTLMAPIMSITETIFMIGLAFGRRTGWDAQNRDSHAIPWGLAFKGLWPQTLFGVALTGWLVMRAPGLIPWTLPVLLSTLGAVPFAVITASPLLGRAITHIGLASIPEEYDTPWEVDALKTVHHPKIDSDPMTTEPAEAGAV